MKRRDFTAGIALAVLAPAIAQARPANLMETPGLAEQVRAIHIRHQHRGAIRSHDQRVDLAVVEGNEAQVELSLGLAGRITIPLRQIRGEPGVVARLPGQGQIIFNPRQ